MITLLLMFQSDPFLNLCEIFLPYMSDTDTSLPLKNCSLYCVHTRWYTPLFHYVRGNNSGVNSLILTIHFWIWCKSCTHKHSPRTLQAPPQSKLFLLWQTIKIELFPLTLTLLHSERPKLYTILAFLSAIGLKHIGKKQWRRKGWE